MAEFDIGQKQHLKKKKSTKNFTTPYSIPFLGDLLQNKAFHNFHKRGQETYKSSRLGSEKSLKIQ